MRRTSSFMCLSVAASLTLPLSPARAETGNFNPGYVGRYKLIEPTSSDLGPACKSVTGTMSYDNGKLTAAALSTGAPQGRLFLDQEGPDRKARFTYSASTTPQPANGAAMLRERRNEFDALAIRLVQCRDRVKEMAVIRPMGAYVYSINFDQLGGPR